MLTHGRIVLVMVLTVGFLMPLNVSAGAQGKDKTPAEEKVCDGLHNGKHNALYGKCVAFCEAKNCDDQEEYSNSCSRLLANFMKKSDGVVIPCLQSLVPENAILIDDKEFQSMVSDGSLIPLTGDEVVDQNTKEQARTSFR